jgi:hypothetical protein
MHDYTVLNFEITQFGQVTKIKLIYFFQNLVGVPLCYIDDLFDLMPCLIENWQILVVLSSRK